MQWPREPGEGMGEEEKGHLTQVGGAAGLGGCERLVAVLVESLVATIA